MSYLGVESSCADAAEVMKRTAQDIQSAISSSLPDRKDIPSSIEYLTVAPANEDTGSYKGAFRVGKIGTLNLTRAAGHQQVLGRLRIRCRTNLKVLSVK